MIRSNLEYCGRLFMKILHTADLHLQEKKPETIKSLELILELAKTHEVDLLTISGDMFDSPQDADNLRIKIRNLFNDLDFSVLAIPGNHDERVFRGNLDFGNCFHALTNTPVECVSIKNYPNVNIVGVPFIPQITDELLVALKENRKKDLVNILLIHCTLDISFSKDDFGENESRYLEVDKSTLCALNYDFVLSGHFHSRFDIRELSSSCTFIYPGSPVSLTWKEIGERKVAILDTDTQRLESLTLNGSFYRDVLSVEVVPDKEEDVLEEIDEWIHKLELENGDFTVQINGFGNMDEKTFSDKIKSFRERVVIENNYKNITEIISHPLYLLFQEELQNTELSLERESIEKAVIKAMGYISWEEN